MTGALIATDAVQHLTTYDDVRLETMCVGVGQAWLWGIERLN